MSTSLVPVLQREFEIFDESQDNHRASLKNLKAHAKNLDPWLIPLFVAEVSEAIDASDSCTDDTILVFEMLARLHGQRFVPNIRQIMPAILRTFSSRIESFESCSKVVSAMALYGIDPLAPAKENMNIIQSISKPLSDALMCFEGITASGAAECLMSLVNLDVWRFASNEIANEVCLKVTAALREAPTQTNSHIGLVMALAKHNSWVLEAYVRSIMRSGLKIMSHCLQDDASQKCFSIIRMIDFLMRCADARSFLSEIESIIEFMERCQNYQSSYVQDAAFEALQTAKIIAASRGIRNMVDSNLITDYSVKNHYSPSELCSHRSQSPLYGSFVCSAMSGGQSWCDIEGKRMWDSDIDSNGGAEKDGFFGAVGLDGDASMVCFKHCRNSEPNEGGRGCSLLIRSSNFSSTNLLAESACISSKRNLSIGPARLTSPSRSLIPSPHSRSNSTVRHLNRRCPSSKDEAFIPPNENDYLNTMYPTANSGGLKTSKEQKIHGGVLRGGESPSCDSRDLASNAMKSCSRGGVEEGDDERTLNLRKFSVEKALFGRICGVSMVFLVIILLALLNAGDEFQFDVSPT